jgi:biopolymer transport protein ExbD
MKRLKKVPKDAELDITSFMNLMIVLVPVLLLGMVFAQTAVLELQLPQSSDGTPPNLEELNLEIIVRKDTMAVNLGPQLVQSIPKVDGKHDYKSLSKVLQALKLKLGREKRDLAILSEPDINYQTIVSVMDAAKTYPAVVAASLVDAVLFPDVSLGDAPDLAGVTP